jgi:glutamyl-tRNA reductase
VVSLVFPRTKPPLTDLALRGEATASMKPIIEPMSTIVKVRETKKMITVDLRHDRIFQPGTAYIKDSAMPYLVQAEQEVRTLRNKSSTDKKEEKKILLRSFTQKLPTEKDQEEADPKLSAMRSKVLFMLFAKETLAP